MSKTYRINGAEISADFFTKEQKKDDQIINMAEREYKRFMKALKRYNEFKRKKLLPIFEKRICVRDSKEEKREGDKATTIYSIARTRRMKMKQALNVSMDDLAKQAKMIIDKKIEEYRENLSGEKAELFEMLKAMFLEKNKISFNQGILLFIKMKLTDPDLKKAQELLIQSMNADVGRLSITCEEKMKDGEWRKCEG